jgi:hypothetical protein
MYDRVVFFWTRSVCFKSQVKPEIYDFTCTDQMTCSPRLIPFWHSSIYFNSNLSGYIWCMIKVSWSLNNSYCSSSCGYSRSFFYSINIEHSPSQRSQNQHKYVCFKSQVKPEIYDFTCTDQMTCSPRLIPLSVGQRSIVMFYFFNILWFCLVYIYSISVHYFMSCYATNQINCVLVLILGTLYLWTSKSDVDARMCWMFAEWHCINFQSVEQFNPETKWQCFYIIYIFWHSSIYFNSNLSGYIWCMIKVWLEVSYHTCCVFQFAVFTRS